MFITVNHEAKQVNIPIDSIEQIFDKDNKVFVIWRNSIRSQDSEVVLIPFPGSLVTVPEAVKFWQAEQIWRQNPEAGVVQRTELSPHPKEYDYRLATPAQIVSHILSYD